MYNIKFNFFVYLFCFNINVFIIYKVVEKETQSALTIHVELVE